MSLTRGSSALALVVALWLAWPAGAQSRHPALEGMWSNPPATPVGRLCAGYCADVAIDRLNALLDDPASDSRPFPALMAEAQGELRKTYIEPRLTPTGLKNYPLDPADDPGFLRCEPWGFARQIFAPHDLEIRQRGNDRLELRYGEWDARRTVYLDGRSRPANQPASRLGNSVGHWETDALVIETSGIAPNRAPWQAEHSDQLLVVERYTKAKDGTLWLTATLTDPVTLREPLVLKKMWQWAPDVKIYPYVDCKPATDFKRRAKS
jgi:hypothetical protein